MPSNRFNIFNTRGSLLATINETKKDTTSTTLVLQGRGNKLYGLDRTKNLVGLLENFANGSPPPNQIAGQLWWDTTTNQLLVYNEAASPQSFEQVVDPSAGVGFNVIAGQGLTGGGKPTGREFSQVSASREDTVSFVGYNITGSPSLLVPQDVTGDRNKPLSTDPESGKIYLVGWTGSSAPYGLRLIVAFPERDPGRDWYKVLRLENDDPPGGTTQVATEDASYTYPFVYNGENCAEWTWSSVSATQGWDAAGGLKTARDVELLDGSPLSVTLNIGQGTGITVNDDSIETNDSEIVHDDLSGFVPNEHIDHSAVTITHGSGFSSSSSDITASQTMNLGAGFGISTENDAIAVNSLVVRTVGNYTISGQRNNLTNPWYATDGNAGAPGWSFDGDTDTGIYRSGTNELSFATGGTQRFRIESNGVLRSLNSGYESLVVDDDDIPNKKYVDDVAAGAGGSVPTDNTFIGITSLSGLTVGKKYLINIYGTTRNNGTGSGRLGQVRIYDTATGSASAGPFLASSPFTGSINWPDGHAPQSATLIWTATVSGISGVVDWKAATGSSPIEWEVPMQMTAVQLDV